MIKKSYILRDFNKYKQKGLDFTLQRRFDDALTCFQYCGSLCRRFPIHPEFADAEIENAMCQIGESIISENNFVPTKNRYVFYASTLIDKGALTEQYLNYLIYIGASVLVIVRSEADALSGESILYKIKENENLALYFSKSRRPVSKIVEIYNKIAQFRPSKAFIHNNPEDVIGFTVFTRLKQVERYYIDHNNHTFWYGVKCTDYLLGFSNFGHYLALKRGFKRSQLLNQPFYPILEEQEFKGFDFDTQGKVIGFAGANLYKFLVDKDATFLKLIKQLLKENPDFIFVMAGWGLKNQMMSLLDKLGINERFYFIGKRTDYLAVIKQIDIYFDSYPIGGGLARLYAVVNHKPVLALKNKKLSSMTSAEEVFDITTSTPDTSQAFLEKARKLINDEAERVKQCLVFNEEIYTKTSFNQRLDVLLNQKNLYPIRGIELDFDYYLDLYIHVENEYIKRYYLLKCQNLSSILSKSEKMTLLLKALINDKSLIKRIFKNLVYWV